MRLIIVANRLPFSLEKVGEQFIVEDKKRSSERKRVDRFSFKRAPGGLVSGFISYLSSLPKELSYIWLGWPGTAIEDPETQKLIKAKSLKELHSIPVFLTQSQINNFYKGFCNQTLWPLLHNFSSFMELSSNYWKSYIEVNELFAKQVIKVYKPGDLILVQDFHLMLVPALIREKYPDAKISFFFHTPFPAFNLYKLLPKNWRIKLLEGITGADLVGFHTGDYVRNFKSTLSHILGSNQELKTKVGTFPLGIDLKNYQELSTSPEILEKRADFKKIFKDQKILLSVDRLDYTKGIAHKLEGYKLFLKEHPQFHKKVVLVVVAAPSREGIEKFQQAKIEVDKLVGEINGELGSLDWMPVIYQYRSYSQEEVVALYGMSEVALVTPLKDGMNLVAKEYLASRTDKKGVLVLSRMAGAAHELKEAVLVNPLDFESIAQGIYQALTMSETERLDRNAIMVERLTEQTVFDWARSFNRALTADRKLPSELVLPKPQLTLKKLRPA